MATALMAVAAGTLPGASAASDSAVVIRGTDLPPGNRAQLTLVGCSAVFDRGAEAVQPMIGLSTGAGAVGKRSLAFDPVGGSAVGMVSYVDSMATTTVARVSVQAATGTTGVAYAGYQAPKDAGTNLMWIGRAELGAPAGPAWSTVDVPGLGYVWTQYDMSTHQAITRLGSSGVPAFVQAMGGDGYGFYAIGFGCDGNTFNLDAWRIGRPGATASYDFEGYRTTTTISGPSDPVPAGRKVTLRGTVVDDQGAPVAGARAVLEAKQGDGTWDTVDVADGAQVEATVQVAETTTYRWKVFSTPMVEGSTSEPFTVRVQDPADPPSATPTDPPSTPPSTPSTPSSSAPASQAPAAPVQAPAEQATPTPKAPAADPTPAADPAPAETIPPPSAAPSEPAAPPADASEGAAG